MLEYRQLDGACSSTAERLTVAEEVAGSKPVRHPGRPQGRFSLLLHDTYRLDKTSHQIVANFLHQQELPGS